MGVLSKLSTANKALVAALGAALSAAAPAVINAVNEWVAAAIGLVLTGAITYRVPNKES